MKNNKKEVIIYENIERWLGQLNLPINEKFDSVFQKKITLSSNIGPGALFNLR